MAKVSIDWKFNRAGLGLRTRIATLNSDFLRWLGQETLDTITPHVPLRGGDLRKSGKVDKVDRLSARVHITWDAKTGSADLPDYINKNDSYARYVYEGIVYGPNKLNKDGLWYSAASDKASTGKPMTYHMPGTHDHWDRVIQPGGVEYEDFRAVVKDKLKDMINKK